MRERWLACALLAASCGGADPAAWRAWQSQIAKLVCTHQVDCGFLDGAEEPVCEAQLLQPSNYDAADGIARHALAYDRAQAQKCLDAIKGADCTVTGVDAPAI